MNLREAFEQRNGRFEDRVYFHVLELALDDQKQYIKLTQSEIETLIDPGRFPPGNHNSERLDEIRERLMESMAIIADIIVRRKIAGR